jgi:hypothetical protein
MNWVVEFFMLNYNRMMGNGYGMLFRLAKTWYLNFIFIVSHPNLYLILAFVEIYSQSKFII